MPNNNNIQFAKNFTDVVDAVYKKAAVTAGLAGDPALTRAGAGADEIAYKQIGITGLGDYVRTGNASQVGYPDGASTVKWETVKFNYDRGARFVLDVMDSDESRNTTLGQLAGELARTAIAPEGDAFTFAKLASVDGINIGEAKTLNSAEAFLNELLEAKNVLDEDEVPESDRWLYATATLMNSLLTLDTYKSREVLNSFTFKSAVPQNRFYTAIDLLDGRTEGEEVGHYQKNANGKDINFMIIYKPSLIKFDKHVTQNIIPAANNPNADGDLLKYRKYGITDVYKNKVKGIYLSHKA